jgi:hypothetical protein
MGFLRLLRVKSLGEQGGPNLRLSFQYCPYDLFGPGAHTASNIGPWKTNINRIIVLLWDHHPNQGFFQDFRTILSIMGDSEQSLPRGFFDS